MTKKFDVVIGNPPYQEEAQGDGTHNMPIYHQFMDAAYEVGTKVVLITPARFLFNAGFTPKAWNEKMLADEHLSVAHFESDSNRLFPSLTDPIKGGIAVTYRDSERKLGPIGFFTKHPELNTILHKVIEAGASLHRDSSASRARAHTATRTRCTRTTLRRWRSCPEGNAASSQHQRLRAVLVPLPRGDSPAMATSTCGSRRDQEQARHPAGSAATTSPALESFDKYKVAVPAANGSGSTTDFFGVALNNPTVLEPGVAVTQTFITIGSFETEAEAQACLKYVKSKFARTMLGILKVTQHNPRSTWKYVPAQDFTSASDIDWTKTIPEIDAQLYAKYGLDPEEIAFIEAKVKPME